MGGTFDAFDTLGVCASVADVSSKLQLSCSDPYDLPYCNISVPGFLPAIQRTTHTLSLVPVVDDGEFASLAFRDTPGVLLDYYTIWNDYRFPIGGPVPVSPKEGWSNWTAIETALYFCVQTLHVNVSQGVSSTLINSAIPGNTSSAGVMYPYLENSQYGISGQLSNIFSGDDVYDVEGDVNVNISSAMSATLRGLALPPYGQASVEIIANNVATSISNMSPAAAYYTAPPAFGKAYVFQPFVVVSWPWLVALIVVDIMALIFLILVVTLTTLNGTEAWKSSAIAVLRALMVQPDQPPQKPVQDFDAGSGIEPVKESKTIYDATGGDVRSLLHLGEMEKQAQALRMRLAKGMTSDSRQEVAGLVFT